MNSTLMCLEVTGLLKGRAREQGVRRAGTQEKQEGETLHKEGGGVCSLN